jgi:hypothetical protein
MLGFVVGYILLNNEFVRKRIDRTLMVWKR